MNVRLNDGTVRCLDHFDASSYEAETDESCLYCDEEPAQLTGKALTEAAKGLEVHYHAISVKGVHPNNIWHRCADGRYELAGSAWALPHENMTPCTMPALTPRHVTGA